MFRLIFVPPASVLLLFVLQFSSATARQWQDATGKYTIQGDLIARSADQVVIKKEKDKLVAVNIAELSKADQDYLKSKESEEAVQVHANRLQTWTFRSGLKASGHLVDYTRREVTLSRKRAKVYVNDRTLDNLPEIYQVILRKVVAYYGSADIENNLEIEKWLGTKGYQPQKFTLDGVVLALENGDEYAVPFFLFSDKDQALFKPGWERWLQAQEDKQQYEHKKAKEQFLLEAQARAYQQQQQQAQQSQQIAHMQLALLATATGAVSLWEVALYPAQGYGYPLTVVVPAKNSEAASAMAMQRYPGYAAGEVARASY